MKRTRWHTLDFLAFCDPKIRQVYEYWDCKRGGRRVPSRADLDPSEIVAFLPSLMLCDVISRSSTIVRYRVVGTCEAQVRGGDPTGHVIQDAFYGRSSEYVLENYRQVIEASAPLFDCDVDCSADATLVDAGTILLPLGSDGQTVDQVMAYAALSKAPDAPVMPRRSALARYPGYGRFASLPHRM